MPDATPCHLLGGKAARRRDRESEYCWVTAAAQGASLPGYVCVVSKTHVTEPFDLRRGSRRSSGSTFAL